MANNLPPGAIQLNSIKGPAPQQRANIPIPHLPPAPTPPVRHFNPPEPRGPGMVPPPPPQMSTQMPPPQMPPRMPHQMPHQMPPQMPHQVPPPQMPLQMPPQMAPPPRTPIQQQPPERRGTHAVEISDIRCENLTEADARHRLSSFVVIRLEKSASPNEVDDEGYPLRPTWQRVARVEETDISQQEATRKVRELMKKGPVADKKGELGTSVQRQLEAAQVNLEETEPDPRYHYILAQLESKTRKIEHDSPLLYDKDNKKSKKSKDGNKKSRDDSRKSREYNRKYKEYRIEPAKSKHKDKLERVSVTAYFKRTPRAGENALRMLEEKERSKYQHPSMQAPPMGQPMFLPQPMQHSHPIHPQPQPPQPQPQPPPPPPPPPPGFPMPGQAVGPIGPGHQGRQARPADVEVIPPGRRQAINLYFGSCRESRSSFTSDEFWDSDGSEYMTPESSAGSSSRPSHHGKYRNQSGHRPRDRPENFGLEVPRRHSKRDQDYLPSTKLLREPSSPGPRALAPAVDLDRILEQAYRDGRDDAARVGPLRPKVIQAPPAFRRLPDYEARREIFAENLDRMGDRLHRTYLDNEDRQERDFRREQDGRYNRQSDDLERGRMQDRLRRDSVGGIFRESFEAQQHMRSRERSREVERESPFSPVGRRGQYYVSRYPRG
ncbi:Uncharacterized protein TPAR_01099 [Tolypocladium paradoxum]|uniref:Uncharacterized protein n=1 Tax=Tolypocladium paradoxum TaxID=94208 RepID=A0A2S4L8D0_9HYPO|nr:Uncharacterized protein TPAR_01099 [Tolypocladium paradoxum]